MARDKMAARFKVGIKSALAGVGVEVRRLPKSDYDTSVDTTIVGPYKIHNFGDDLIGAVMGRHLVAQGRSVRVNGLSVENSRAFGFQSPAPYGARMSSTRNLVVGGGGLLGDAGVRPKSEYMELGLDAARRARRIGADVKIVGVGAGPLAVGKHRDIARALAAEASHIAVRDAESYQFCVEELGVAPANLTQGADVALLWPDVLGSTRIPNQRLGLQCDITDWLPPAQEKLVAEQFALSARESLEDIFLITPMRSSELARYFDESFVPQLRYDTLKDYLPHLSGLRAIVTTHLHISIAAYAARVPCFTIYVNDKTRRFYDQIGRPDRALPATTASVDAVRDLIDRARVAEWEPFDDLRLDQLKVESAALLETMDHA
ncbi:polysaccharide pyruvyl transferase family protein [Microbacterium xanthum]|uniref:polysaccharide pyruvyl transferase family protein n=1 Tax=Microbacterium xanthum TaxID=3079794 RepID=UPI002AD3BE1C|nr:polysaccharide pyruvyl transferase family protein [Microbacterium sp. KSW-48]MDZ8170740.1 polysaccharide pyruvyl transferase family protein [Microbacterium sp. KSW-48]